MSKCKSKVQNLNYSYSVWFFLLLRFILIFIPQNGYVSSEEFSGDIAAFAGNRFNLELNLKPTPLYNKQDQKSSMIVSYIFYGWSYDLLWILDVYASKIFQISLLTPTILLITPRIAICLLSYLIDWSLYKIDIKSGGKYRSKSLILASSYCMLIYTSRTLVNIQEIILFSLLLYFVIGSKVYTNNKPTLKKYLLTPNKEVKKIFKQQLQSTDTQPYKNIIPISIILVLGCFNRPIFFFYALTPIMFWLCRDLGYKQYHGVSIIFIKRYLILFCVTLPIAILMMIVESDITFEEALNIDVLNYKIIPTINQNIGLGSDQLLVNWNWKLVTILGHIMILFPMLGVYTMVEWIRIICKFKSKKKNASKLSSIHVFMNLSLIFSTGLLILSVKLTTYDFLPLIIPFVYINGAKILKSSRKTVKTTNYAFKLWICINMLLALFNGFLHEGGVLPATMYLSKSHQEHQIYPVDIHIVTSHVSPIPQMLFMQYEHEQEIFLHEYGKSPITTVIERIATLRYDAFVTGNEYQLYFLIPSYKHNELISALQDFNRVDIKLETSFYPHVTVEAFKLILNEIQNYQFSNVTDLIYATSLTFNLDLYAIQP